MKVEQISPQDDRINPQGAEQLNFDFEEAEVRVRAKELRKEHGWTEPYAMSVARIEFKRKKWEAQLSKKEKSN